MRYHVVYLAAGEREATHVDAPDAASAVVAAKATRDRPADAFELLLVTPDEAEE